MGGYRKRRGRREERGNTKSERTQGEGVREGGGEEIEKCEVGCGSCRERRGIGSRGKIEKHEEEQ